MRYDKSVYRALTYFSQFTINMLVPVFLCSAVGYFLDQKLGTSIFFIILFFVGALAGFRNIFILAGSIDRKGDPQSENKSNKNKRDS